MDVGDDAAQNHDFFLSKVFRVGGTNSSYLDRNNEAIEGRENNSFSLRRSKSRSKAHMPT